MLLALPGVTLYRVNTALSRGMTVMQHDIYSRGLTESFGTALALLLAFASAPENWRRSWPAWPELSLRGWSHFFSRARSLPDGADEPSA